tara:strand:+ start:669 stop:1205 length:537 start_codon:yes stop_codon:yes gene_type:complete
MSYLVKVQNFFLKNDPDRYYLAKKITRTFRGNEDAVMARLEEIYAKGGPKKLKVKDLAPQVKKPVSNTETTQETQTVLESNSESITPKKSKKKLFIIVGLLLALGGAGFGFYMTMGHEESHDDQTHSTETHSTDSTHEENSHQPAKTIEEIEKEIDQAEKDSVTKDIIDAAEALQFIR